MAGVVKGRVLASQLPGKKVQYESGVLTKPLFQSSPDWAFLLGINPSEFFVCLLAF